MTKAILTFSLTLLSFLVNAQGNYKQKLGDVAVISFPKKPVAGDTLGIQGYRLTDSIALYVATFKLLTTDDFIVDSDSVSNFYDKVVTGLLKNTKGKLISKRSFEINGLKGVEVEHHSDEFPGMPDLRYDRIILLNNTAINITFWTFSSAKEKSLSARDKFFSSFKIIANKAQLVQGTENSIAYKMKALFDEVTFGHLIGAIILISASFKLGTQIFKRKNLKNGD